MAILNTNLFSRCLTRERTCLQSLCLCNSLDYFNLLNWTVKCWANITTTKAGPTVGNGCRQRSACSFWQWGTHAARNQPAVSGNSLSTCSAHKTCCVLHCDSDLSLLLSGCTLWTKSALSTQQLHAWCSTSAVQKLERSNCQGAESEALPGLATILSWAWNWATFIVMMYLQPALAFIRAT